MTVSVRGMKKEDFPIIEGAFKAQGWEKPATQYERYFEQQIRGERTVIIAEYLGQFAGYLTIVWNSNYPPFSQKGIPEIVDLNVLQRYQKQGIATKLMDEAEKLVAEKYPLLGIGFGLMEDYGAAQRMYVKRGYVPDGRGISQNGKQLKRGDHIEVNDDLALYLVKKL